MSIATVTADLKATMPEAFAVLKSARYDDAVDIKVRPSHALRPDVDFVRVIEDDGTFLVIHFTHNEVIKGEARFSNSLTGMVTTMVREIVEGF